MISLTPPLKPGPDSKIGSFTDRGKWDSRELAELAKLAESLNVDLIAPAWLELSGIPDMWARPILFEIALFDENHLLFERTVGEWRGLLAVLALREVSGFNVTIRSINIEPNNKFLEALQKLMPQRKLANDDSWGKISIIYYDGKPIGITSPMTLVCTSATLINLGKITWAENLRLADPIPKLNDQKKRQLTAWLNNLEVGMRTHLGPQNVARANSLLRRIQDFISDLGVETCSIDDGINILPLSGIYKYISRPVGRGNQVDTHLAIVGTKGNPQRQIIVVDADIAQQWEVSQHDIVIYNGITLDHIQVSGIKDETIIGPFTLQNHRVWESTKLFAKELHLISTRDALPLAHSSAGSDNIDIDGDLCTPILPLVPELLDYFTPEDLSKRVTFHQDGESIIVALTLELSGQDGHSRKYRATRKYTRSSGEIITIPNIPLLSIWPNFLSNNWNLYYSLCWSEADDAFSAKPLSVNTISSELRRSIRGGEVVQMESFPEVYSCSYRGDNYAGLLLVKKPETVPNANSDNWKIGVDFGTTGTNVYYTSSQTGTKPLFPTLKRRHLLVTKTNEAEQLNIIFLPNDDQEKTFLSVFRDVSRNAQDIYRPLLDGHIFYLKASSELHKYEAKKELGDLRDDIKWGGGSDERVHRLVKAFLKQLCLQTMAEAAYEGADEVSWAFSYPSSFSYDLKTHFQSAWTGIAQECHDETGLAGGQVRHEPESVAAAKYFHSSPEIAGTFASGAICIDIGGGTSDVSIWHGRTLLWQTSLRFAGRDMFTNVLQNNAALREVLGFPVTGSDRYARIATETTIREKAGAALNKLNEVFMNPNVKEMRRIICLSLSAMLYYVGLATKKLIMEGKLDTKDCPNIYIAGGGSHLFHWAAGTKFDENQDIARLFKHMFTEAAGLDVSHSTFKIAISPKPKDEAAIGLVSNSTLTFDAEVLKPIYLSGEGFILNGKEVTWDFQLDAKVFTGATLSRSKPIVFESFLKSFNSKCGDYGMAQLDYIKSMKQVGMKVEEIFANYRDSKEDALQVEPVFISYAKIFIESLGCL